MSVGGGIGVKIDGVQAEPPEFRVGLGFMWVLAGFSVLLFVIGALNRHLWSLTFSLVTTLLLVYIGIGRYKLAEERMKFEDAMGDSPGVSYVSPSYSFDDALAGISRVRWMKLHSKKKVF